MKILLTGHKGYIGAVAGPVMQAAGHEVVGLDVDLFAGCDFGEPAPDIPELKKDLRELSTSDLAGFDAVAHFAALSNDPLGNVEPRLTYDINHLASVQLANWQRKLALNGSSFLRHAALMELLEMFFTTKLPHLIP